MNAEQDSVFHFGFIPALNEELEFGAGVIQPVMTFEKKLEWLKTCPYINRKGWFHPIRLEPADVTPTSSHNSLVRRITQRMEDDAAMFKHIPASHQIRWFGDVDRKVDPLPSIVVHLLGFVYGTEVQFEDWWFDGRVPVGSVDSAGELIAPPSAFRMDEDELQTLLFQAYNACLSMSTEERQRVRNMLHLHNRIPSYSWVYDRFAWQYNLIDACWKQLKGQRKISAGYTPHAQRIQRLCSELKIEFEDETVASRLSDYRNNLLHEVSWDSASRDSPHTEMRMVTSATTEPYHYYSAMRGFVSRLLLHILNIECEFRLSSWFPASWECLRLEMHPTVQTRQQ